MLELRTLPSVIIWSIFTNGAMAAQLMVLTSPPPSPSVIPGIFATGTYTISTSALLPFVGGPTSDVPAWTEIVCALRAHRARAFGFLYEGGVCSLQNPGQGTSRLSSFFKPDLLAVADLEEVARNKVTYGATPWGDYVTSSVVDGLIEGVYVNSFSLDHPWWLVDIGEKRKIFEIQIYPRLGYKPEIYHDVEVRIGSFLKTDGDLSAYELFCYYTGPYDPAEGSYICSSAEGIEGRYVSVQKVIVNFADDTLQLQEVAVYALKL